MKITAIISLAIFIFTMCNGQTPITAPNSIKDSAQVLKLRTTSNPKDFDAAYEPAINAEHYSLIVAMVKNATLGGYCLNKIDQLPATDKQQVLMALLRDPEIWVDPPMGMATKSGEEGGAFIMKKMRLKKMIGLSAKHDVSNLDFTKASDRQIIIDIFQVH